METSDLVREILKSSGLTQERLAERLGVAQSSIHRWLLGASPRGHVLRAIHEELSPQSSRKRMVPLRGNVGAGGAIEAVDAGDMYYVEAPPNAHPETVAGQVVGLSMLPAYENATTLYWSRTLPPDEMINRRCVVQLADNRIMVKLLRRGSRPGLWTLVSLNPAYPDIEDVPVEWVAKIDWIKPA